MKKTHVALVLLLATALGGVAHASPTSVVWSNAVQITKIDVEGDPSGNTAATDTYMKFSANPLAHSCTVVTGTWVVGGSQDNIKQITQFALAARLAGHSVKILFNNSYSGYESCNGGGTTGIPKIRGIEIQ